MLLVSCRHIRPCEQALAGLAVDGRVFLRWHRWPGPSSEPLGLTGVAQFNEVKWTPTGDEGNRGLVGVVLSTFGCFCSVSAVIPADSALDPTVRKARRPLENDRFLPASGARCWSTFQRPTKIRLFHQLTTPDCLPKVDANPGHSLLSQCRCSETGWPSATNDTLNACKVTELCARARGLEGKLEMKHLSDYLQVIIMEMGTDMHLCTNLALFYQPMNK